MLQDLEVQKRQDLTIFRFDNFDREMSKPANFKVRGLLCIVSFDHVSAVSESKA